MARSIFGDDVTLDPDGDLSPDELAAAVGPALNDSWVWALRKESPPSYCRAGLAAGRRLCFRTASAGCSEPSTRILSYGGQTGTNRFREHGHAYWICCKSRVWYPAKRYSTDLLQQQRARVALSCELYRHLIRRPTRVPVICVGVWGQ